MLGEGEGPGSRYRAFISYSHADAAFGRMLHRKLESYRVPSRLVGKETARGTVPARLAPIFRDREELAAADDLSAEVKAALADSACLIIVCSPNSKASPWVAREIELFRSLHGEARPVLAALIEGEPKDCFPDPLHRTMPDGALREPIAADFRKTGDGRKLALLKLIAGVSGLDLDALVQRDAQRRFGRVTAVTVAAVLALLVTGLLLVMALNARAEAERQRAEAERQRAEAEGLIEFMLDRLRPELKGAAGLKTLTLINEKALDYYSRQGNLAKLSVDSLGRRARVLHAMGEDYFNRGKQEEGRRVIAEAYAATWVLLARKPNDVGPIFAHAQSEYWMGYAYYKEGLTPEHLSPARSHFGEYRRLAARLLELEPGNPDYVRELGYGEGNLCAVVVAPPPNAAEALRSCSAALAIMERAARGREQDSGMKSSLVNRHGWMADAWRVNGNLPDAYKERAKELGLIKELLAREPDNRDYRDQWVGNQLGFAELEILSGKKTAAARRLREAIPISTALTEADRENREWARRRHMLLDALKRAETR
jgi:hypothetical protein